MNEVLDERPMAERPLPDEPKCSNGGEVMVEAESRTNKARFIEIESLDFGYVVRVGCQKFAVESIDKLTDSLKEYLQDPNSVERKWFKGEFLK
jgi:hypothetical protein